MPWLIMFLGLILRLPLFTQSLWLDEAIEALALQGKYGNLWSYSLSDFQPPLYHYLLLPWTQLAGTSEWALRLPSLLAGLGTIYLFYRIGADYFSSRTGIIAGLLAATNPLLIYYSQEGRTYALTTFLVTASMYYFFKIYQNTSNRLYTIYYILYTTLYLWTSYLTWFLWLALALYLVFSKKYRILLFHFLSALTLVFWLPQLFRSLQIGISDATTYAGWGSVVGGASLKALALTWVKFSLGRVSFANKYLYGLVVITLVSLHLFILNNLRKLYSTYNSRYTIILLWLLAGILLPALISLWIPVYSYTRVLFVLPAYLLLLAIGLSNYHNSALFYVLCAIQLCSISYFWFTPRFHKEDWRSLVTDFNRDQSAQVLMPSLRQNPALLYYQLSLPTFDANNPVLTAPRVYYLNYVASAFDPDGNALQALANNGYTITSQKVYPGIQVDIYENRN